jgi:hypothetical protein
MLIKKFIRSRAEEIFRFGHLLVEIRDHLGYILIVELGTPKAEFLPLERDGVCLPSYIYLAYYKVVPNAASCSAVINRRIKNIGFEVSRDISVTEMKTIISI